MKMSELSDAAGVNSATIRYYIRQGLLPRPYKTHKNMAYYDEQYIDRVLFIKKLQKEYFLPLDVIKDKIDERACSEEPGTADEVVKRLSRDWQAPPLPDSRDVAGKTRLTREEFLDRTHLSRSDFEAALQVGFVSQDEEGLIDAECLEFALLLAGLRKYLFSDQGLVVEFFRLLLLNK
ncbi:MAG: MerR family transcriptional regulator [Desulfosudaceae bacterium]